MKSVLERGRGAAMASFGMLATATLLSVCALLVAAVASVSPALAAAPEAPVAEAQSHTATSAFLQGVLNPGAEPPQEGTYEFLYAVSPTPCTGESKGTRGLTFGFNGQEVGEEIGGLSPHTTYTVCLLARNLAGEETLSTPESFRTSFEPEAPETAAADAISTSNAMLHGTLNPNSSREEEPGFYEFLYKHSANECEGEGSTGQLPAITGQEKEAVQAEITGLAPGAQYTVCLRAWNATGQFAQGAPVTFRTEPEAPAVSEESASSVSARSAHVSAQLNTGGLPVTYTVQYGTTTSYGSETEPVEVSASVTSIPASLTGLQPGTEYHYRFEVTNTQGELQGSDASFATAPGTSEAPASEGNCPNEQIRKEQGSQFLPECRAYEMVSPSYKEGYGTATGPNSFSSNGERAIIRSFATLAGVQGEGEIPFGGAFYLDTRTANGWRLSPINPPQSQLAGQILVAPEADDGESLWVAHTLDKPGSARELYLGSALGLGSTGPSFSLVGPLNSGEPVAGEEASNVFNSGSSYMAPRAATSDHGHIIVQQGLGGQLYEYTGTNNSGPVLVGVYGGKGSTDLIGECGTYLGSYGSWATFNALSRDGETVFFSPCWSRPYPAVFARVHGSLSSSQEAETVEVSESECVSSCGEESGKVFEGASEDGKLVYLASTQKLTNDAVDGTKSGDAARNGCAEMPVGEGGCNLYQYDFKKQAGERLTLVAAGEVLGVAGISEDGSHIYFASTTVIASAGTNPYGGEPQSGQPNLYVYAASTGETSFIATLSESDFQDWEAEQIRRPVEVAGTTGQFMVFASVAPNVTPDDHSEQEQLFEYKARASGEQAELVRVTQGENGFAENGNAVSTGIEPEAIARLAHGGAVEDFKSTTNEMLISEDGQSVFFTTAGQLSPRAVSAQHSPACQSGYEFHAPDGILSQGKVSLISDGHDVTLFKGAYCGAKILRIDATGANVLFFEGDSLTSGDVDGGQFDIYDARVNGGFSSPVSSVSCEGTVCEGSGGVSVPGVFGPPATVTLTGVGNLSGSTTRTTRSATKPGVVKCRRGLRRSGHRCVKRKSRARKRARAGSAGVSGRGGGRGR